MRWFILAVVVLSVSVFASSATMAQVVGTYVDADESNTTILSGRGYKADTSRVNNSWLRCSSDSDDYLGGSAWLSQKPITPPTLRITARGLSPHDCYSVYVVFRRPCPRDEESWGIRAAISGNPLVTYITNCDYIDDDSDLCRVRVGEVTNVDSVSVDVAATEATLFEGISYNVKVKTANLSPDGGDFITERLISSICETPDASIRYTMDGTEPTEKSFLYKEPIQIEHRVTIRTRAFKAGYEPSTIVTKEFGVYNIPGELVLACPDNTKTAKTIINKDDPDDNLWFYKKAETSELPDELDLSFLKAQSYRERCGTITTTVKRLIPSKTYNVYLIYSGSERSGLSAAIRGQKPFLFTNIYGSSAGLVKQQVCYARLGTVSGVTEALVDVSDAMPIPTCYYGISCDEVDTSTAANESAKYDGTDIFTNCEQMVKAGKIDEAFAELKSALSYEPQTRLRIEETMKVLTMIGDAYSARGEREKSALAYNGAVEAAFCKWVNATSDSMMPLRKKVQLAAEIGSKAPDTLAGILDRVLRELSRRADPKSSVDELEQALNIVRGMKEKLPKDKQVPDLLLSQMLVYFYNRKQCAEKSMVLLNEIIDHIPNSDPALPNLAKALLHTSNTLADSQGKYEEAIIGYRRYLELQPNTPIARLVPYTVLNLLGKSGQTDALVTELKSIIGSSKNSKEKTQLVLRLGNTYYKQERYNEAVKAYAQVYSDEKAPEDARALAAYGLGMSYKKLGEDKAAVDYIQRIIKTWPDSNWAKNARGLLYSWASYSPY